MTCPNKVFYGNLNGICEVVLKYADMKTHLEKMCPYRIVRCKAQPDCVNSDFARNILMHEMNCPYAKSTGVKQSVIGIKSEKASLFTHDFASINLNPLFSLQQ